MTMYRLLGTWVLLAVAMTANGAFRELALRPWFGARADTLSVLAGALIILGVTGVLFRPVARHTTAELGLSGVLLVGLTVTFEFTIGRLVDQKSWSELAANYAFWRGELWPLLLILVAATPFIWGRWVPGARHAG